MEISAQLLSNRLLACEMSPASDDSRRWMGVYTMEPRDPKTRNVLERFGLSAPLGDEPVFRIRVFDLKNSKNGEEKWLSEADLENQKDYFAFGRIDLFDKIEGLGVNPVNLRPQGETEYPI